MGFKDSTYETWDKMKGVGKKIFTKPDRRTTIEKEVDNAVETMKYYAPFSAEYSTTAQNVERMANAQAAMDEAKAKLHPKMQLPPIDASAICVALVGAAATIGCTMLIVSAESESGLNEYISTRAVNMIPKVLFKK